MSDPSSSNKENSFNSLTKGELMSNRPSTACEPCQTLHLRCVPSNFNGNCTRCAHLDIECTYYEQKDTESLTDEPRDVEAPIPNLADTTHQNPPSPTSSSGDDLIDFVTPPRSHSPWEGSSSPPDPSNPTSFSLIEASEAEDEDERMETPPLPSQPFLPTPSFDDAFGVDQTQRYRLLPSTDAYHSAPLAEQGPIYQRALPTPPTQQYGPAQTLYPPRYPAVSPYSYPYTTPPSAHQPPTQRDLQLQLQSDLDLDPYPPLPTPNNTRSARLALQSLINDTLLNPDISPVEAVSILEDCQHSAQETGISFGLLLNENLEGVGVSPLYWEIMRFDLEKPELLLFIVLNVVSTGGGGGRVDWIVRKACIARGDNKIYQWIKQQIPRDDQLLHYDLSLTEESRPLPTSTDMKEDEFRVFVVLHDFMGALVSTTPTASPIQSPQHLQPPKFRYTPLRSIHHHSPPPPGPSQLYIPSSEKKDHIPFRKSLSIEWIAHGRAWLLSISSNSLSLVLLQGEPTELKEVSITAVLDTSPSSSTSSHPTALELAPPTICLSLPSSKRIVQLQEAGVHKTTLDPCFPIYDVPYSPHSFEECVKGEDSELLLEVSVRLGRTEEERERDLIKGKEREREEERLESVDGDDWERVSSFSDGDLRSVNSGMSTPRKSEAEGSEWVLASWSGKDEDL